MRIWDVDAFAHEIPGRLFQEWIAFSNVKAEKEEAVIARIRGRASKGGGL